jgi:hypothetical protein
MSVNVAAGFAFLTGQFAPFNQGTYGIPNDGTVNLAIAAADGTNPRDDLVILQVRDDTWGGGGGLNDARLVVVTGTPAASPTDPSLASFPNNLVLARVRVGAGVTSITNANITDLRTYAGRLEFIRSQWWELTGDITPSANASESLSLHKTGSYADGGRMILVTGQITNTKGSNWAGGDALVTFPVGYRPSSTIFLVADNINNSTRIRFSLLSTGVLQMTSGTVSDGHSVYFMGVPYRV